ncbi:MAG: DUF1697 domain-containing protein [Flavobacteriaceae bacterium]|nr:DUF1697 domain-containing protein [Flavobacteriaceae bacterium]
MLTYIALLRGINVSGHHKIKMSELKQLFLDLGYHDVSTYIQSGNVIFKSNIKEPILIEDTIISAISKHFGHAIKVLILTKNELTTIFNSNPFLAKNPTMDISKLHVTILNQKPDLAGIPPIEILVAKSNDEFQLVENTIYLYCPNGYGNTKLNNNLFEKKLMATATTRNWKTIGKLVELSNQ